MTGVSLGDMALGFVLRKQNATLKAEVQRFSTEVTTGVASDPAARVRGDFAPLGALETSLRRIDGYRSATSEAGFYSDAMQAALSTIEARASGMTSGLLSASNSLHPAQLNGVGIDAEQAFRSAVAALSTTLGDRTLFAGTATTGAALADADAMLAALDTAVAGAMTAADVEAAVTAWFEGPSGFATEGYLGGPPLSPVPVAPDEFADLGVTAADPALRDTLKGMALAAMLNRGVLSGDTAERAALARASVESLLESQTGRADLAARIGTAQQAISAATSRNAAEESALQLARTNILGVDPYEAAAALTDAETKLETLYAVTARTSRLSLADYI
jgi:flagellar hook-associated protein 3 FlgL